MNRTPTVPDQGQEAFDAPVSPPPLADERGPATGHSGDYPDGTLPRWLGTPRGLPLVSSNSLAPSSRFPSRP